MNIIKKPFKTRKLSEITSKETHREVIKFLIETIELNEKERKKCSTNTSPSD